MEKEFFTEFARGFADKANKMKNFIIKHIDKVMTLVAAFVAARCCLCRSWHSKGVCTFT